MNEETKKLNLLETEKNRTPTQGYSLGFQKIEDTKTPNVTHHTLREGHIGLNHTINLSFSAPVNEDTRKVNLLETEQKSHSDTGL